MHRNEVLSPTVLFGVASDQRGLITRPQLVRLVASEHSRRRLVRDGWLRRVRPGVYAVGGHAESRWDPAVAALLLAGPGAALSHRSAAMIHRFPGLAPATQAPELTVLVPRHPRISGVIVHRVVRLDQCDLVGRPPVVYTAPARTLVDLAADLPPSLVGTILDEGTVAGLWTAGDLRAAMGRVGGRGRAGRRVLGRLLADRCGEPRVGSVLELRVIRALAPLGPFETQYQLVIEQRVVVLDVAWPGSRVGVEVDGFAAHGRSRTRFDADCRRDNLLTAHGWRIAHVTSTMSDATILDTVNRLFPLGRPVG